MSNQPPPEPRIRFLTLVPILAVLIALGFVWYARNKAPRVAAGQLIRETGVYTAPRGTAVLTLRKLEGNDRISVDVSAQPGTLEASIASWEIDGTQPWLFTFDADDKLWGYSPDQGPHSVGTTPTANAFTSIGIHGGWSGIPESFLQALPTKSRDVYHEWRAGQDTTDR